MHFRLPAIADVLAARFLLETKAIKGTLVEESGFPFHLWLEVGSGSESSTFWQKLGLADSGATETLKDLGILWEPGTPATAPVPLSWAALFKRVLLSPDSSPELAEKVIVQAKTFVEFAEVIKMHHQLQQGTIACAGPDPKDGSYYLSITQPSLWALQNPNLVIFNRVTPETELYLQRGLSFREFRQRGRIDRLRFLESSVMLCRQTGDLQVWKPVWRDAQGVIDIRVPAARPLDAGPEKKVLLQPFFREVETESRPRLWIVDDLDQLKRIINAASFEHVQAFSAWFSLERIYLLKHHQGQETGLEDVFSDTFAAFYCRSPRVFLPRGRELVPNWPEDRLLQIFQCPASHALILEHIDGTLAPLLLPQSRQKPLPDFIEFCAARACAAILDFEHQWQFDFPPAATKAFTVPFSESSSTAPLRFPDAAKNAAAAARKTSSRPPHPGTLARAPETRAESSEEIEHRELRRALREIDQKLLGDTGNADLWQMRAEISRQAGFLVSGHVSGLTAAVVRRDVSQFRAGIAEFCRESPEFLGLVAGQPPEEKLLVNMRKPSVPLELHFALHYLYGTSFQDGDILRGAIEAMRTGYAADQRPLHTFETGIPTESGSFQAADTFKIVDSTDQERISRQVVGFMQTVRAAVSPGLAAVIQLQLQVFMGLHLASPKDFFAAAPDMNQALVPPKVDEVVLTAKWRDLKMFPELPPGRRNSPPVAVWHQSLQNLSKLGDVDLKDLFKGDVYRSPFDHSFRPIPCAKQIFQQFLQQNEVWKTHLATGKEPPADSKGKIHSSSMTGPHSQRLLLTLLLEHGTIAEFYPFLRPFDLRDSSFNTLVMNCDIYRSSLVLQKSVDEAELFSNLLYKLPHTPPDGYCDFKDAAENITLCLYLSSHPSRSMWLNSLLRLILVWLEASKHDDMKTNELLTTLAYHQAGLLLDQLPKAISLLTFQNRRKSLWMDFANFLQRGVA
jgi:hypothetical protein